MYVCVRVCFMCVCVCVWVRELIPDYLNHPDKFLGLMQKDPGHIFTYFLWP